MCFSTTCSSPPSCVIFICSFGHPPVSESTPADDVEPLMEAAQQFVLEGVTPDGLHKLITTLGMLAHVPSSNREHLNRMCTENIIHKKTLFECQRYISSRF